MFYCPTMYTRNSVLAEAEFDKGHYADYYWPWRYNKLCRAYFATCKASNVQLTRDNYLDRIDTLKSGVFDCANGSTEFATGETERVEGCEW